MGFLQKLYLHFKNNTLLDRVKYQFSDVRHWDTMNLKKEEFYIHKLENNNRIKLYRDSYLSYLILRGSFENDEINFIKEILTPQFIFLDVGANVGLFTIIASKKCKAVYSFEPTPKIFKRLEENIKLNEFNNVFTNNIALSNHDGIANLIIDEDSTLDAWNRLSSESDVQENNKQVEQVKTTTLDNFIKENQLDESKELFLKIDVEGWEKYVLEGAENLLNKRSPILLIEFNDDNFKQNGYSGGYLIGYLQKFGYQFYEFHQNELVLHIERKEYPYINLVAFKSDYTFLTKYIKNE